MKNPGLPKLEGRSMLIRTLLARDEGWHPTSLHWRKQPFGESSGPCSGSPAKGATTAKNLQLNDWLSVFAGLGGSAFLFPERHKCELATQKTWALNTREFIFSGLEYRHLIRSAREKNPRKSIVASHWRLWRVMSMRVQEECCFKRQRRLS